MSLNYFLCSLFFLAFLCSDPLCCMKQTEIPVLFLFLLYIYIYHFISSLSSIFFMCIQGGVYEPPPKFWFPQGEYLRNRLWPTTGRHVAQTRGKLVDRSTKHESGCLSSVVEQQIDVFFYDPDERRVMNGTNMSFSSLWCFSRLCSQGRLKCALI